MVLPYFVDNHVDAAKITIFVNEGVDKQTKRITAGSMVGTHPLSARLDAG